MDLKLKVVGGRNDGRIIAVSVQKFLIGRASDCHLRPNSDMISRHHCAIIVEETSVVVRDFGSRNGSFINGEPVVGEQELKEGDRLRVGPLEFMAVIKKKSKKRPKVKDVGEAMTRTAGAGQENDEDLDLAAWFDEPHEGEVNSDTSQMLAEAAEESNDQDEEQRIDGSQPGKLPPQVDVKHKDSQEAAAEMLRKYYRRR